jgi:hypothetical protein
MPLYLDLRDDLYGATAETGQTGREMLAQAPAVESVYAEMKRVRDAAGVIV